MKLTTVFSFPSPPPSLPKGNRRDARAVYTTKIWLKQSKLPGGRKEPEPGWLIGSIVPGSQRLIDSQQVLPL